MIVIENLTQEFCMFAANPDGLTFSATQLESPPTKERQAASSVNVDDNYIFLIGGEHRSSEKFLKTVALYNIAKNIWTEDMPKLNKKAKLASACYIEGSIYVIGGFDPDKNYPCGVEKLNLEDLARGEAKWELIEDKSLWYWFFPVFFGRICPIVAPIS